MKDKLTLAIIAAQVAVGLLIVFFAYKLTMNIIGDGDKNSEKDEMAERLAKAARNAANKNKGKLMDARKRRPDLSALGEVGNSEENDEEEDENDIDEAMPAEELLDMAECPTTTLAYELVGLMLINDKGDGIAACRVGGTTDVRLLTAGSKTYDNDELVVLTAIGKDPNGKDRLVFNREGKYECMDYDYKAQGGPAKGPSMPFKKKDKKGKKNKYSDRIRKEGSQTVVEQSMITEAMTNMTDTLRQAKMRPYKKNGKMAGFKFQRIKSGSMLEALGFQKGDVITKINGLDLSSPDKALELYGRLRSAREFSVEMLRNGKASKQDFSLR